MISLFRAFSSLSCALLIGLGPAAVAQTRTAGSRTVPFNSVTAATSYVRSTPGSSFSYATNPKSTPAKSSVTSVSTPNCLTTRMVSCTAQVTSTSRSIPGAYVPSSAPKAPTYNVTVRNSPAPVTNQKTDAVSGCPLRISNGRYVCDLTKKW